MVTRGWLIFRVVLPLGMAASSPVVEWAWPRNEVAKLMPVALPALMAVFHLAGSSLDRPERTPTVDERRFRRCMGAWHALDGLACLLLMAFEMAVAIVCTMREAPPGAAVAVGALFFVPYLAVALVARRFLLKAYESLAAEFCALPDTNVRAV